MKKVFALRIFYSGASKKLNGIKGECTLIGKQIDGYLELRECMDLGAERYQNEINSVYIYTHHKWIVTVGSES